MTRTTIQFIVPVKTAFFNVVKKLEIPVQKRRSEQNIKKATEPKELETSLKMSAERKSSEAFALLLSLFHGKQQTCRCFKRALQRHTQHTLTV